jgi:Amt family ammonium transporter
VHGTCGLWGILSLGLFADGTYGDGWNGVSGTVRGLFYGDSGQFIAQCIGGITNLVFVFVVAYAFFKITDMIIGHRTEEEDELQGLDIPEMGVLGYPEAVLASSPDGTGKHSPVY